MTNHSRRFMYAAVVSAAAVLAVLILWYAFIWPTSDVRTRMYLLLFQRPLVPLLIIGTLFSALGGIAVWAIGWRDRWALLGAVGGAAVGVLLLWSRVLGGVVWRYDNEVTLSGQVSRAGLAFLVAGLAVALAMRARRSEVAA